MTFKCMLTAHTVPEANREEEIISLWLNGTGGHPQLGVHDGQERKEKGRQK
jgi:hypothetical protein